MIIIYIIYIYIYIKETLSKFQEAIEKGGDLVCENLANAGMVRALLDEFSNVLLDSNHPLNKIILHIISSMGQHKMKPNDIHR